MKRILILVLALLITGCASFKRDPEVIVSMWPVMPASVKAGCVPVPNDLKEGFSMGDLLVAHDSLIGLYAECAVLNNLKATWYQKVRPKD